MKLNACKFGIAASITAGLMHLAHSAIMAYWPSLYVKIHGYLLFILNASQFSRQFEFSREAFVYGFLNVVIMAFILGYVFATIYNYLVKDCACHLPAKIERTNL